MTTGMAPVTDELSFMQIIYLDCINPRHFPVTELSWDQTQREIETDQTTLLSAFEHCCDHRLLHLDEFLPRQKNQVTAWSPR